MRRLRFAEHGQHFNHQLSDFSPSQMGSELSVPGFGWANKKPRIVDLDRAGFAFAAADALNETGLAALLNSASVTAEEASKCSYATCLAELRRQVSQADYEELISSAMSCGRRMRFDVMSISPNTSFTLHAHPNVEIIYVLEGEIFEYRFQGNNLAKDRLTPEAGSHADLPSAQFRLGSVKKHSFLINSPGSVHLSFTRSESTKLLVLWSGSHWSKFENTTQLILAPPMPEEVLPL